ncbi:glutamyl-tRNA(Gln) amidotransferase subunit B, mitochondrial [Neosynchiropus ocellatus]
MMATSAEETSAKVNGSAAPINGKRGDQQLLECGDVKASNGVESPHRRAVRSGFSSKPTLEDIRRLQAEFTDERDWSKFHQPRNLLLAMVGEVGEVSELFQWRGEVAPGLPGWSDSEREHLAQELSDVLIYLVELSDVCGIDLPQAVLEKMALNRKKYPASKVHGSAKKYNEYD